MGSENGRGDRYVRVQEVGARDGLQNEPRTVPADVKVDLIERLAAAGLPAVESGAFVSPKWVPQMADSEEVFRRIDRRDGVTYPALTPNMKGFERATAVGVTEVGVFAAASETFSQRNTNCTIAESLERFRPVCAAAAAAGVRVQGYVSTVLGCPYEGAVDPGIVADLCGRLYAMGCYRVALGDTIGVGTPSKAAALIDRVAEAVPLTDIGIHFHDTYGQALANTLACLDRGVRTVDASVSGLGGCPYAPGAAGNLATEDLIYMLDGLGMKTGVDLDAVAETGAFITGWLGRAPASRVAQAFAGRKAA
ncbi:MAG: hydroxymethylglutaryl-CoA lyase [Rhodospirillaceae bacterium]|nr:hydroxymethylglutaryl-CoA lyase [Rhodospirillaceae bacterium]MYH35613.1 hydroxymethylglutaryl-CoA lyase [Rhodospirillaceae bacterium]MYK16319.1 hydroxymethylglutaryl-CoA lyase [Rhodospirillaceae bacterium]MYK58734.1 hydroxymethylglutaryl-CoA lyase [Rhodospirillaceae bacterium]